MREEGTFARKQKLTNFLHPLALGSALFDSNHPEFQHNRRAPELVGYAGTPDVLNLARQERVEIWYHTNDTIDVPTEPRGPENPRNCSVQQIAHNAF